MREEGAEHNDLLERLAADPRLGLSPDELNGLLADPSSFTGAASTQVADVVRRVEEVAKAHPEAAGYVPSAIL
jgi:adenylosuccinate lyase